MILSYYDGEWHDYAMHTYDITVSDGTGGVWLSDSYGPFLQHITGDLNSEYYSSSNSNLPEGEFLSLYVDSTGILWVVVIDSTGKNRLFSFDGTQWIDYSSIPGYPDGILAVTEDNANDLLLLCYNENPGGGGSGGEGEGEEGGNGSQSRANASIYRYKDNEFYLYKDGFNVTSTVFVHKSGIIYCFGDLENKDNLSLTVKKISPEGNIGAVLNIRGETADNGEVKIDENAALEPGEEAILSFTDIITTNKSYTITISGDVKHSKTIEVKYGYEEHFNINKAMSR